MASWIPLHVHSQYSILEASASISSIVTKAAEFNIPAVALTDTGNLYGAVEFHKACKAKNLKPIIGSTLYVAPGLCQEKRRVPGVKVATQLVLLAKNDTGYHNLCKLSSIGHLEGFYYYPRVDKELIRQYSEGLICLCGGVNSMVPSLAAEGKDEELRDEITWYKEIFGQDYYLEIQRHTMTEDAIQADGITEESWLLQRVQDYLSKQQEANIKLISMSKELGVKLVASNASHYMERGDWRAHEILLNVQSGEPCEIWEKDSLGHNKQRIPNPKRRVFSSHEFYFKSPEEMQAQFSDLPEALENTLEIAAACNFELDFDTKHYPVFWPPGSTELPPENRAQAAADFMLELCEKGIKERYTPERLAKIQETYPDKEPMQVIRDRLNMEVSIIVPKGLVDYLLIVYDFINWSKEHGIPVGPGRGSGAGSIILYLIGITDIEPLRFNLFFERFINPERISYPDIDVDICMEGRGRVIDYTLQNYGQKNVAQIITFGTMKAKMAVKDVGRVLSVPLSKVNEIAKLIPDDLAITIEKALAVDPDLQRMYQDDEETQRVLDLAKILEGSIRNTGIHAAGVIICGDPIVNHIPVCAAKDSEICASQYSMKPVESVGMLKVDFLGLKTLTCIQKAVEAVKLNHGVTLDPTDLPLEDKVTFDLLNQGKTLGVFQLESAGMQELARQLHLDRFEEIIAVVSLYRPGPMDMIPSFISRKHGTEPIVYDHPMLEEILSETYGIMVYQEQVMQISQQLANYSLGEGDVLRRAMGKKDMKQMATQREKFREGAAENGIDYDTSMKIFDQMEKFAAYGFNKSHAAAYGYLSYVTAFLKAHYPGEWMAALMTCDRDDTSKVAKFIGEAQNLNIPILPPDVNETYAEFTSTESGIRFAMAGIKGVGLGMVEAIIEEREKHGLFKSLFDCMQRVDPKKAGKKAYENLVKAGCFDFTGWSRDAMVQSIDEMYSLAMKKNKENAAGVLSLFSLMGESEEDQRFSNPPKVQYPSSNSTLFALEKELLGFYLTGHPMDSYRPVMQRLSCISLARFPELDKGTIIRTAFIIESSNVRLSAKTSRKFAILVISDGYEKFELPIWPDIYEDNSELIKVNQLLYSVIQIEDNQQGSIKLSCKWLADLTKVDEKMIETCDNAYDRAKLQVERFAASKAKREENAVVASKKAEVKQDTQPQILNIQLDADKTRLSHILKMKEILRSYRGATPIAVSFTVQGEKIASLNIESKWGVSVNDQLKKELKTLPSCNSII